MTVRDDSAAFASNWWVVLAVDLAIGLAMCAVGAVLGGWWWLLAAAGFVELFFAGGRATRWRRMRRETP
jgi:hypothetical protein